MKNYTITVNGNVYDVTVEEGTGSTAGAAKAAAPKAAAPKAAAPAGAQDGTVATVECAAGDSVESGKVLVSMN